MRSKLSISIIVVAAASTLTALGLTSDEHFTLKVQPILSEKCFACHGEDPEDIEGDLNLLTREGFLKGGEFIDDVLVPGDSAKSFLMTAIKWEDDEYEMPPKENDRLTPEQIAEVAKWIDDGAPWPDEGTREKIKLAERKKKVTDAGILMDTSGGLADEWTYRRYKPEDLWAFRPLKKPIVPAVAKHPVDAFVREKLKAQDVVPAGRADHVSLLRRLSYTLTGLPPTPTQMHLWLGRLEGDFEVEYGKIVDELLDSPRYGERWAQHWLDVVRYADTAGFSNDFELSNAWRYRDYVIRSFNQDKPYNRFVKEQLAGDELEPGNPEMTVATGFLRMGPWEHTGMLDAKVSRQQYLDDVVDSVGQTFLSMPMSCCKCHDHKFDPLPTRDYYRMYSMMATTQPAEMSAAFLPEENRKAFAEDKVHVERLLAFAEKEVKGIKGKLDAGARQWYRERDLPFKSGAERSDDPENEKPPRHFGLTVGEEGQFKVRKQDVWIWNRRLERFEELAQSVYTGGDVVRASKKLRKPGVDENEDEDDEKEEEKLKGNRRAHKIMPESFILSGGSVHSKTERVSPGVLSALGIPTATGTEEDPYALPSGWDKRRLGFAEWVVDERNGLALRSIVNRVWAQHFGTGLAGNPNNFGATGKRPTHPELLEFLAASFAEGGWSFKKLHKLILTSETWQQGVTHPKMKDLRTTDPNNELLAYFMPRRLTAEELRDSLLQITGEMNPEMGGLPARPEINREVALGPRMIQFSLAPAYQPNRTPEERNRRSIYAYRIRGLADPLMEVFNKPSADDSCEKRDAPSVTPQVFTLMNSEVITNRSIALALRLQRDAETPLEQIKRAYHLVFTRQPSESEVQALLEHYEEMIPYHQKHIPEKTVFPTEISRSLVEEFSGDPFTYTEILDMYEGYTPDAQPSEQSPETRAMADVCLLLFNTNELIYLY